MLPPPPPPSGCCRLGMLTAVSPRLDASCITQHAGASAAASKMRRCAYHYSGVDASAPTGIIERFDDPFAAQVSASPCEDPFRQASLGEAMRRWRTAL